MKRFHSTLTAAAMALCALAANAGPADVNPWDIAYNPLATFHSEKTRDQVQAELAQYQKSGVNPWAIAYNPLATFHGEKTRDQVRAEYLADRNFANAMSGEDSGSAYLAAHRQVNPARHHAGTPGAQAY
jgi:hypothetical protein